jgi:hypothetical protein
MPYPALGSWKHDPGPCPIDDAPHHACTPESVAERVEVSADGQRVTIRAAGAASRSAPSVAADPVTFTTSGYRRAAHGRRGGKGAGR